MRNSLETRLGIFFALALVAVFLVMEVVGSFDFFKRGSRVRARFVNVQELNTGDPVKMGGKAIGRVEGIDLRDQQVEVFMKLELPQHVRTDSKASVKFAGLLGQNFVDIDFGTSAGVPIRDEAILESVEQPDIGSLLRKLDNVATGVENITRSFSGDSIQNLLGPFTDFLNENAPRLTETLENIRLSSGAIARGEGTIGRLINDDALYLAAIQAVTNLTEGVNEARATLGEARTTLAQVREGEGTLGLLSTDPTLYNETATAMVNLKEILEKINRGDGSVGKLVNDDAFLDSLRLSLRKMDKATESLEDQGPLSVLGIAVGSLF
jgi:phospholipid/cholesterol/gamma-HCH transport system substrate-binding protein